MNEYFISRAGMAQSVVSTLSHTVSNGSLFPAPPTPSRRYLEEISSAAMLPTKRSAGVTLEMNLGEQLTCMLQQV